MLQKDFAENSNHPHTPTPVFKQCKTREATSYELQNVRTAAIHCLSSTCKRDKLHSPKAGENDCTVTRLNTKTVGNVTPCCLTGPDYSHDLPSLHAIVPRYWITVLYSR
jgi:hypothetical protein